MPRREGYDETGLLRPPVTMRSRPTSAGASGRTSPYMGNTAFASSTSSLNSLLRPAADMPSTAATNGAEAPFLATAESHLGRMTLTAPDNMRRRKAEEKEKRQRARRKRLERAEVPPNAQNYVEAGTSRPAASSTTIAAANTYTEAARTRRRPALPATRSSSNLQSLYTLQAQRSTSPTRPVRPRSAQNAARSDTSPERRPAAPSQQHERRERRVRRRGAPSGGQNTAPGDEQRRPSSEQARPQDTGPVRAEALRRATQRRGDIYADLSSMGLPGASDSEPEDGPPPFPAHATRPPSPPALPVEGEEWTEEMRRRQEEYLANRPPDSPPPPFQSDEEDVLGRQPESGRRNASEGGSSDDESLEDIMTEERRLWEEDVASGYSFEERVERERLRREAKAQSIGDQAPDTPHNERSTSPGLPNANLGRLVIGARARRGIDQDRVQHSRTVTGSALPSPDTTANASTISNVQAQKPSHHRAVSDGQGSSEAAASASHRNAAIGTGKGIADNTHRERADTHSRVTKIRPRPASESHSRFRDDASAAANRRLALWGPAASTSAVNQPSRLFDLVAPSPLGRSNEFGASASDDGASESHSQLQRKLSSSSSGNLDEENDSSDSGAEWEKEENAFKEMQHKSIASLAIVDTSDEEEADRESHVPGAMPTRQPPADLPELGKVGSTIPRAPPPLVLGRSRGGGRAYSSSSDSSSGSDIYGLRDDEDDSNSDSPPEMDDAASSDHHARQDLPLTPAIGKGKQPMRPLPAVPTESKFPKASTSNISFERAGTFVEESGSSHDFSDDDEEEDEDAESIGDRRSDSHAARTHVQNRLKDLFAAQLSPPIAQAGPSNASDASLDHTFDSAVEQRSRNHQRRTPASSSRRPSDTWKDAAKESSQSVRAETGMQRPPAVQRASSASSVNSSYGHLLQPPKQQAHHATVDEHQARSEALSSISQLQRSREPLPAGVDRDSLAALERLLSRTAPSVRNTSNSVEPLSAEPSKLTRSGAIGNRQMSSSAFVNPRTVNAPRPLGRLPTITDATRHFPPVQRPSPSPSSSTSGQVRSPQQPSGIGTPSWMAYIPASERRMLPDPIAPDRRQVDTSVDSRPRAPSPTRGTGSRVSAMVERFEQQPSVERVLTRPPSPVRPGSILRGDGSTESVRDQRLDTEASAARQDQGRRRPPPPPPPTLFAALKAQKVAIGSTGESLDTPALASLQSARPSTSPVHQQSHPPPVDLLSGSIEGTAERDAYRGATPRLPSRPRYAHDLSRAPSRNPSARQGQWLVTDEPISIFGNLYSAEERSRSSNSLFNSRPLPIPPHFEREDILHEQGSSRTTSSQTSSTSQQLTSRITREQNHTPSPILAAATAAEEPEATPVVSPGSAPSPPAAAPSVADPSPEHGSLPRRSPSLGFTDLDLFASRLADARAADGSNNGTEDAPEQDQYDDLHLLAEFLGPAKAPGLTQEEMELLPVGRVEVLRRRVVGKREDGRDKVKLALAVAGVKVERCGVCLVQFKEGNLACVFPCLHVLHEQCASKLLRNTKLCPTCRTPVVPS